jgi:hypothetical protein
MSWKMLLIFLKNCSKNIGQDLNAHVALIILEKETTSLLILEIKLQPRYLIIKVYFKNYIPSKYTNRCNLNWESKVKLTIYC